MYKTKYSIVSSAQGEKHSPAAELVNSMPGPTVELVCIDYLFLERSNGGYENILVIIDISADMLKQYQQDTKQQQKCYNNSKFITVSQIHYAVIRELTLKIRSPRGCVT